MNIDPIEFGKVLARLDAQDDDIKELKDGQKETHVKLDRILAYQQKQKGATSVLLMMASAVSAVVGWIVSHFSR